MGLKKRGQKGNRKAADVALNRNTAVPTMSPKIPINEAECLTSQSASLSMKASGLAILDTGASRSVIGSEHVAAVLQKLPPTVQCQVREVPSRIGFRFGNNQIAYSFKQLRIPLVYGKQRIWLLIEVVPKATPFLLSIKTMKSLGATIDLGKSTCFLQKLNRSLPLKENSNGLFVIDVADLCEPINQCQLQPPSLCQACCLSAPPGLEPMPFQVNMPTRQEILEGLRTLSEEVMESLRILFYMLFALTRAINPNEDVSEAEVNPIYRLIEEVKSQRQKISELGNIITNNFLGPQNRSSGPSSPTPGESSDIWDLMEEELNNNQGLEPAAVIGQQVPSSSLPMPSTTMTPMSLRPMEVPPAKIAGMPIAKTRALNCSRSWSKQSCRGAQSPSCPHTQQTLDQLGPKANHMGQEARREVLSRDLRFRSRVCPMGPGKSGKPGRGNRGLRELLTDSSSTGRSLTECQSSVGNMVSHS